MENRYEFGECEIVIIPKDSHEEIRVPASFVEILIEVERICHFSTRTGAREQDAVINNIEGTIHFSPSGMVATEQNKKTVLELIQEAIKLQNENKEHNKIK